MPLHKLQSTDGLLNFNKVRQSTEDEHCSGRPDDTCSDDNVRSVQDMIQKDRRLNIKYVADSLKMSYGTSRHIITHVLGYHEACAR